MAGEEVEDGEGAKGAVSARFLLQLRPRTAQLRLLGLSSPISPPSPSGDDLCIVSQVLLSSLYYSLRSTSLLFLLPFVAPSLSLSLLPSAASLLISPQLSLLLSLLLCLLLCLALSAALSRLGPAGAPEPQEQRLALLLRGRSRAPGGREHVAPDEVEVFQLVSAASAHRYSRPT